jgi:GNAT superfamily N-acetyltransferase
MVSLYGQYIKERENFDIIENDYGFATYKIINSECYIRDIFVIEQYRNLNIAKKIADEVTEIAKLHNCVKLLGTVSPSAPGATVSMTCLLAYGFKLKSATNDFVVLEKEI